MTIRDQLYDRLSPDSVGDACLSVLIALETPRTRSELATRLGMSTGAIYHHIRRLREIETVAELSRKRDAQKLLSITTNGRQFLVAARLARRKTSDLPNSTRIGSANLLNDPRPSPESDADPRSYKDRPVYVPPPRHEYARAGAGDFKAIKSRGV